MNHMELKRVALLINVGCVVAGLLAYSSVASAQAMQSTLFASGFALVASFLGGYWISVRWGNSPLSGDEEHYQESSLTVKLLLIVPTILTIFEVLAIYYLAAPLQQLSWIHIVAAGAVGQGLEALLRRK